MEHIVRAPLVRPEKCNRSALEYLMANDRLCKISGLADALDFCLKEYPWPESGGGLEGYPSIFIGALPHPDGTSGKYECRHKFAAEGGEPMLSFRVMDGGYRDKFQSSAPLFPMLLPHRLDGTYTVYCHTFGDAKSGKRYIGLTKQGWPSRWKQHLCAATNGSPYLFHQAIRKRIESDPEHHLVFHCGLSYEDAMAAEEELVAEFSLHPRGLNMIPGGFAGIRYLGQRGFHGVTPRNWEYRSRLIREFNKYCERAGKPNHLISAQWRDDEYASSVICSNPNNFDLERVREARLLASFEWTPNQIAERFSCKTERVERLIRGETYARVH